MRSSKTSPALALAAMLLVVIGAAFVIHLIAPYYTTQIWWEVRKSLFWTMPLIVGGLVFLFGIEAGEVDEGIGMLFMFVGLVALVLGEGWAMGYHAYAQDKAYAADIVVTDTFNEMDKRTPFSVAQAQSRTTLSNIPGADLQTHSTRYDPKSDHFTTLAKGRQMFGNYTAVAEQKFPLAGRSHGTQCEFSPQANKSLDGILTNNLGRAINSERTGVNWSVDDAYGYCDGDTPIVVVPLKRQEGWSVVTEVPAGTALYDGRTGKVTITDDAEGIPSSVYPLSLAQRQRASTEAMGTWMQWARSQIGWKEAEGEVNSANMAEFVLGEKSTGDTAYVTPLSNQGNSTGIAAMSTINASNVTVGKRNPLEVHVTDPSWVSVDAIESRIKADYQDIPNWQTLAVQEIVPITGNRWYATLGNDQNTLYHVIGTGDLSHIDGTSDPDAATCLYKSGDLVRCGTLAAKGMNGIGTQYGPDQNPAASVPPASSPSGPLTSLTDAQLAQRLREVSDEISRRAGKG